MSSAIDRRLLALEAAATSTMVCARCREAGGASICHHIGLFLSLVPRIECVSTEDWLYVRQSGLRALEGHSQ